MSQFIRLSDFIRNFISNTCGGFSTTAAVILFPVMVAISASVEYSNLHRLRVEMQNAVDAAALATARKIVLESSTEKNDDYASDFFFGNYTGSIDPQKINFSLNTSATNDFNLTGEQVGLLITANAKTKADLYFGGAIGIDYVDLDVTATVNLGGKTAEVAFVFDASGSMTDNDTFQKSTKAAHDLLHDMKQYVLEMQKATGTDTQFIRYALVPFAWGVNVGADKQSQSWIDSDGRAANHHRYLDWTQGSWGAYQSYTGWKDVSNKWLTRFTLLDEIGEDWGGCVEAREHPYNLDDTTPNTTIHDTLFVPLVSMDEPDNVGGGEVDYANNYLDDTIESKHATISMDSSNSGSKNKQHDRQEWTSKYNSSAPHKNYKADDLGPNRHCFGYEIYPLNDDFGNTNSEISHLNNTYATAKTIGSGDDDGATNIQQGIVWGWRTVSSDEPFTQGRSEADNKNEKVLIVITDGINSYSSQPTENESEYGAYGYAFDSWIEDGIIAPNTKTMKEMLDEHTLTTCENAKAAGVTIYVVGYGVVGGSDEEAMLKSCAGGAEELQYYFSVDDDTISSAMTIIRQQLLDIRLAS